MGPERNHGISEEQRAAFENLLEIADTDSLEFVYACLAFGVAVREVIPHGQDADIDDRIAKNLLEARALHSSALDDNRRIRDIFDQAVSVLLVVLIVILGIIFKEHIQSFDQLHIYMIFGLTKLIFGCLVGANAKKVTIYTFERLALYCLRNVNNMTRRKAKTRS